MDFNETSRIWSLKSGLDVRLINEMSKYFNFSMKIIECNKHWGMQLPNKTWSGIIGKIVSKVQFTSEVLTAICTSPKTLINKKAYLIIKKFIKCLFINQSLRRSTDCSQSLIYAYYFLIGIRFWYFCAVNNK